MRSLVYIGILMLLLAGGCAGLRKNGGTPADFRLQLERTPCFGKCPVYTMDIDADGKVNYHGHNFTDHKGHWTKTLSADQQRDLTRLMRESDFFSYDTLYDDAGISDLPSIIIAYTANGETHRVTFRYGGPVTFRQLAEKIEAIVTEEGYSPVQPQY